MINTKTISLKDEHEIIKASLKNPREFKVLYDLHYSSIFRFVNNRVGEVNSSADIVSEVFYKALNKLDSFSFKGISIKSWLYKIAFNEVMTHFRKTKNARTVTIEEEYLGELAEESETENVGNIDELKEGLDQLEDDELALIELKYFEKRSHREIAEILDISEANAKVKTHRAVKKLRGLIIK